MLIWYAGDDVLVLVLPDFNSVLCVSTVSFTYNVGIMALIHVLMLVELLFN